MSKYKSLVTFVENTIVKDENTKTKNVFLLFFDRDDSKIQYSLKYVEFAGNMRGDMWMNWTHTWPNSATFIWLFLATLNVIDVSTDRDTLYKIITNNINETSKRFTLIPQYWIVMLKCWYTHDYDGSRYGENYSACRKFQMNNSDIDKYM